MDKVRKTWILRGALAALVVFVVAFFVSEGIKTRSEALADGIAKANGRIEARQINIASKIPARIRQVLVEEGDMVEPGQVLAILDTTELEAQLASANAQLALNKERILEASAQLKIADNQVLLAKKERNRIAPLVASGGVSKLQFDQAESAFKNAEAALLAATARLHTVESATDAAKAQSSLIESQIADCSLRTPARGRVLYRMAEPSEVVAAGNPLLTVLNLNNIYMEVFLPASAASRLAIGASARIKLDIAPDYTFPATVTFVSPEAQFTPKQVETKSDRENLMFRTKLRLPQDLIENYIDRVKTGVRGDAYIQVDDTPWPEWLQVALPDAPQ